MATRHRTGQAVAGILVATAATALWAAAVASQGIASGAWQNELWMRLLATGLDITRLGSWLLTLLLLIRPTRSAFGWSVALAGTIGLAAMVAILDIGPDLGPWVA